MRADLVRSAELVREVLSRENRPLLNSLLGLVDEEGCANYGRVLQTLYPDLAASDAVVKFNRLRVAIGKAAEKAKVQLRLVTDGRTRTAHAERDTWFEADLAPEQSVPRELMRPELEQRVVPPAGMQVFEERRIVRCLIAFAHRDKALKERLMITLKPLLEQYERFRLRTVDQDANSGEPGRDAQRCEVGLALLSRAGSPAVNKALKGFPLEESKVVRAALAPMPSIRRTDVFTDASGRSFAQLSRPSAQDQFAAQLMGRLKPMLDGLPEMLVKPSRDARLSPALRAAVYDREFQDERLVPWKGRPLEMSKNTRAEDLEASRNEQLREDALSFLMSWIESVDAPAYCALLGEYGMGKTTACKALALGLIKRREAGEQVPFPLYLDLRNVGEDARRGLLLEEILTLVVERSWKGGPSGPKIKASELIAMVENEGAVVIWDGLDEVLVHLNVNSGQLFTRQLYRMVPPRAAGAKENEPVRKLLISCRTHYFRTLREQKNHFLAEGRDNVRAESYRAFLLVPFDEGQIREYVANTLPDEDTDRVMETLDAVHNLRELAERPYTLHLIVEQFAQIERDKAAGRQVTGLTLYRNMVLSWLERDEGKHLFTPDHKQALMEYFAAEMWRNGERYLAVQDLEKRLVGFMLAHPEFAEEYRGKDYELLKEDLRTATFLVREGEDRFRFAHTSLQEFFLAGYLRRALVEGVPELWAMPAVSSETLDFLGQWLLGEGVRERDAALRSLGGLRDSYCAGASELVFRFALVALKKKYPGVVLAGLQLPGADLREMTIWGAEGSPLMLAGANFRGANLRNTDWRYCNLERADFGRALAGRGEWVDCYLADSGWVGAELTGAGFRSCVVLGADFAGADLVGVQGLGSASRSSGQADKPAPHLSSGHSGGIWGCAISADGRRIISASWDKTLRVWDSGTGQPVLNLTGHEGEVTGCAISADGRRIVSASWDKTLQVWDGETGQPVLNLTGHEGEVTGCAVSADGRRIVSSSADKTLRVWDGGTGQPVLTLTGHEGVVTGCAISADGRRIVSSSADKTLRVWDSGTGQPVLTLTGHEGVVWGCAISADGRRIVSASWDKTLRVWDSGTGQPVLTLTGHEGTVTGCAVSADGRRIVSSSADKTLRVWDSGTGQPVLTLTGHEGVVTGCAVSADGRRIVSASGDKTLRVWDSGTGQTVLTLTGHEGAVTGCAVSADGRRIVSSSADKTLRVWDSGTGQPVLTLTGHEGEVTGCAVSADGRRIVSASGEKTLRVWDSGTGQTVLTLTGHEGAVTGCAVSADGRRIVSSSADKTLRVWDSGTGQPVLTLTGHEGEVTGCAVSADGRRIVSSSADKTLRVWDSGTGQPVLTLTGHEGVVWGCAISADGRRIVSSSADKTLRVWDSGTGQPVLTLTGHEGVVWGCAISADGRRIVSSSADKTLRVWDSGTGQPVLTLTGHEGEVTGCAISADGRRIVSASTDGSVRIWDAESGEQIGPSMYHLSHRGHAAWASIDERNRKIIGMGKEAWRSVGWTVHDPETGMPEWAPADAFGPVPVYD